MTPSPHVVTHALGAPVHLKPFSTLQASSQPSPVVVFPSSPSSPVSTTPSPQAAAIPPVPPAPDAELDVEELVLPPVPSGPPPPQPTMTPQASAAQITKTRRSIGNLAYGGA